MLLRKQMQKLGWNTRKFLIDGFPRNRDNYDGWQKAMGDLVEVPFIVFLDADEQTMVARITERSKTSGRNDDNIDSLRKRFVTFRNDTMPIVDIYAKQGKMKRVTADGTIEEIFKEMQNAFELV